MLENKQLRKKLQSMWDKRFKWQKMLFLLDNHSLLIRKWISYQKQSHQLKNKKDRVYLLEMPKESSMIFMNREDLSFPLIDPSIFNITFIFSLIYWFNRLMEQLDLNHLSKEEKEFYFNVFILFDFRTSSIHFRRTIVRIVRKTFPVK